jgi:hypothetical protein
VAAFVALAFCLRPSPTTQLVFEYLNLNGMMVTFQENPILNMGSLSYFMN